MEKHYVIEADFAKDGLGIVTAVAYKKHGWSNAIKHEGDFTSCFNQKKNLLKTKSN